MDVKRVVSMNQDGKQGNEAGSRLNRTQQMAAQSYPPPQQQVIAPAFDQLYCQCGCGAPIEAVGHMHAAASAQQQAHRHHSHHSSFNASSGGAGLMHPHMYAAPYPTQHDMAQHQLQSQIAAAAAMNQYTTGYGRGLPELDPYRSTHMQYRPQMDLPRGYTVLPPGAGTYLAPSPHLAYYRQYPGMMHVSASGGEGRVRGTSEHGPNAGTSGASPEAAPPPPHANPPGPQEPGQGQQGSQPQPQPQPHAKESAFLSLMSTRSDGMSGAGDDSEMNGGNGPAASSPTSASVGGLHHQGGTPGSSGTGNSMGNIPPVAGAGTPSSIPTLSPHMHIAATSPLRGRETAGGAIGAGAGAGAAAAAAAAVTAATAMQLTGLRGGFPSGMHALGGIPGMAPPHMHVAVTMPGGPAPPPPSSVRMAPHQAAAPDATAAMNAMRYMGAAAAAVAAAGAGVGTPSGVGPSTMGFASHDAFEEHMRQQEKKLQKRAANRRSAQLSRKRKKALIEDLKYENQDLQRHEDILEVIPDPVFAFETANGSVWFASNSASAQFGLPVEDLTSSNFFDLMTEDCAKRLRVLIDTASKDMAESGNALLHERMTVRFKKRKAAILLGELSGRLSRQSDGITAVCSVRPLSLAAEESLGKGYFGDASVSELVEDTSVDQGSSGEDSRSGHTGVTSGSTAGSSSGLGTGCTSIADEGSSSVPSLSSLEVKRNGQGRGATSSSSSVGGGPGGVGADGGEGGGGASSSLNGSVGGENGSAGAGRGSSGSNGGSSNNGSEEGGAYNSDSLSSGGVQDGFDEPVNTDSEGLNTGPSGSRGGGGGRSRRESNVAAERSKRPEGSSSSSSTRSSVGDRNESVSTGGVRPGDDADGRRGSARGKRKKENGGDGEGDGGGDGGGGRGRGRGRGNDCERDDHAGADPDNNGSVTPDSSSPSLSPSSSPSSSAARGSDPDAASEIPPFSKRQYRGKVAVPSAPALSNRDRIIGNEGVPNAANQITFSAVRFSSEGVAKPRRVGTTDSKELRIAGQVIKGGIPVSGTGEAAMARGSSGRNKQEEGGGGSGASERGNGRAAMSSSVSRTGRHEERTADGIS